MYIYKLVFDDIFIYNALILFSSSETFFKFFVDVDLVSREI